jgi:DNA-binding transcriptional LysR family regulator
MSKLSIEALQIIDAIERAGSMSGASELLHRVPSTISYSIGKLEEQLDLKLFDRNGPKVTLTAAGRELLKEGRCLLRAFADLECRLQRIATGYESELRIAHDSLIPSRVLIDDLRAFERLECGTRIRITSEVMTGAWESLRDGRADIVIAIGEGPTGGGYIARQIDSFEFAFCVAPAHPLASSPQPLSHASLQLHSAIVVADTARTLPPRTVGLLSGQKRITVPSIDAKLAFQRAGLGFGFLPRKLVEADLLAGRLIELAVEEPRVPEGVWLAWRTGEEGEALRWWSKQLARPLLKELW